MSGIIMIKTMMGLGVLSIPSVFDTLGMIPGVICLLAVAAITTWSSIQIQHFKLNHPSIYGVDDAGQMIVGRIGREVLYGAFILGMSWRLMLASHTYSTSLDLGGRLWNDQHLHRPQCGFRTRYMQCCLYRCCCHRYLHAGEHTDSQ